MAVDDIIYRVTVVSSIDFNQAPWKTDVKYCGYNRTEARVAYHANRILDTEDAEPGYPCRTTYAHLIAPNDDHIDFTQETAVPIEDWPPTKSGHEGENDE